MLCREKAIRYIGGDAEGAGATIDGHLDALFECYRLENPAMFHAFRITLTFSRISPIPCPHLITHSEYVQTRRILSFRLS
uniref:Uncharacterized protein n=1 Tax=Pristionchus pacificus TaxID=54126 RepID=A0A2A6C848_PRIPA|eukprot:PDM74382.1 hypothetical protein PRIPAC_41738 [Pristionchus pacificus]